MGQLIIAIIVIYLYYLLIRWLLGSIGPELFYIVSVGVGLAVPIVYGRALFRVFGNDGWRNALLVPLVILLTLIYFDLTYLSVIASAHLVHGKLAQTFQQWLAAVVFDSLGNQQVLEFVMAIFNDLPQWGVVLGSVAIKSAFIPPFALLARGIECKELGKAQPAFLWYFHGEAFPDLWQTVKLCAEDLMLVFGKLATWIVRYSTFGPQAIIFWPLTLFALLALIPPAATATLSLALLLLFHGLTLSLIWLAAMYVSALLFVLERTVIKVRSGYAKCPHAGCHQSVPLPILHCPRCSVEHDLLLPGRFGVFKRRCRCGHFLPTLFWLGKGRLFSRCPHCRKPMLEELFGGNLHVPIYGGPSTGKTMFMMALTWRLMERHLAEVRAKLIDEKDRRSYHQGWKKDFESGVVREKTAAALPEAFLLSVRRRTGLPVSLYLYDPSGEAFRRQTDLQAHRFIRYYDGMALLIDPLSLPRFADRYYQDAGAPNLAPTTSPTPPYEVIEQIVNQLEEQAQLSRERAYPRPLAVILSKADIPLLRRELGFKPARKPNERWAESGEEQSQGVRAWLERYEPHLVQLLDTRFSQVRYFAVSALGHDPGRREAFRPEGVLPPLTWLLSRRQVMARPELARLGVRSLEVAAVAAVVLVFLGLPIGVWLLFPVLLAALAAGGS